jgi:hypothetical protein
MIDRQQLLADLKPLLRELEADLRARCDEVAQINTDLTKEYEQARAANRAGVTFEEWRADLITQVGVAWVLSSVFVRFLEDNALISPPRISGPSQGGRTDAGLQRARDERDVFFRTHPKLTDRDYLLAVFDDLAKLPGTKDVFGPHNPVSAYRDWLSGDAAQKFIEFFQKIDADGNGEILHDFTDAQWDTRFLGDLYQDLSEAARKKYALLQTPIFVEEFILERTLEPAIKEFGLKGFKMIDPACGSGHFVLGSFARILNHWRKAEPGTSQRELVNRSLASVHGVDLNPYAVAIARFRLLLVAMKECQVTRLRDAPSFKFNLACGDSLLHGSANGQQQVLGFHEMAHHYQSEDIEELRRILRPGQYHAVVANPPYITVNDKALGQAYRVRYPQVCHRQYSLSVPFLQRLFVLACEGGFTGQITSNSFMKREFGKKLIEDYLPKIDLTHVVDSSGAFIPGHSTPTIILYGRHRRPVAANVRALMSVQGEPATPDDPAKGAVWTAITTQIDRAGSNSPFISTVDLPRESLSKHPWSIGGGGASELKQALDERGVSTLADIGVEIGIASWAGIDDVYATDRDGAARRRWHPDVVRPFISGDYVRDWSMTIAEVIGAPYDRQGQLLPIGDLGFCGRSWWPYRTHLLSRVLIDGSTFVEADIPFHAWVRWIHRRYSSGARLVLSFIATHNHLVLDRGGNVFNRSAPVITLPATATNEEYLVLLGLMNSSTACFWMKQVLYPKATTTGDISTEKGKPEANRYEFAGTAIERLPIPFQLGAMEFKRVQQIAAQLDAMSVQLSDALPASVVDHTPLAELLPTLAIGRSQHTAVHRRMVALQEELDWEVYKLVGVSPTGASPEVMAASGVGVDAEYRPFSWGGDTAPGSLAKELKEVYEQRRRLIKSGPQLALLETLVFKRPWWGRQGVYGRLSRDYDGWQLEALTAWLTRRIESCFDLDGRMNDRKQITACGDLHQPRLTTVAKLADLARADKDFMHVAEIFTGRMDFDVGALVGELVAAESVPHLPILRYKPSGLDKRTAWERTWNFQRLEDAIDALFDLENFKGVDLGKAEETFKRAVWAVGIDEDKKPDVLREVVDAAGYLAEMVRQKLNLASPDVIKPITDAAKRAKRKAIGDIPVPPRYTSADFLASSFWRLRGKLDVPKERWVSFPHCEGEDGSMVIAWAGYDHLQLARAIAERYEHAKEQEGRKLVPLLAAIGQLIPWLTQWHNELDPAFGTHMGDYFDNYLAEEAKALGQSVGQVMSWAPPEQPHRRGSRRRNATAEVTE